MAVSTENATTPQSTKWKNSNSSFEFVQIQIEPKSHFVFVPRDTEKCEFLDLVDFGGASFSVETVIKTDGGWG